MINNKVFIYLMVQGIIEILLGNNVQQDKIKVIFIYIVKIILSLKFGWNFIILTSKFLVY